MGNYSQKYHLGKAESLLKASIELLHCVDLDPRFSQVTSVVAGVSSVRFLILSAHCFNVDSLPAFDNSIELKLVIHKCFSWELLTEFLNRSPLLQCLVLEHSATSCKGKYSEPESDSIPEGPKPRWHAPELVPSCLMSNLETVSIEGFKGQQDTMEVAKYFLRNSEVLKKMTISSDPLRAKKQTLYKKLRKVPRVSEACRVDFV
uniref:F-box/FBD/LRR-repeat protein At3g26920-like n=1 Tax=Fragaria vesca subsp. vesca TaxID=101020 RepID=UPI0005C8088B|nr:PREDICTED: F-box/FBD/LRR-repeat protein At3g26920-like [Fragaria vesca subsp. vesca]